MVVSIKLCLDVGNDQYIILRNFGGRTKSGLKLQWGTPPFPVAESEKKGGPPLNRVKVITKGELNSRPAIVLPGQIGRAHV